MKQNIKRIWSSCWINSTHTQLHYTSRPRMWHHPRLSSVLKLFLFVSFYRLLRFSWLSCPSFLKSVCLCRVNNYRHQGSVPIFLFCYISLPLILLTISLVFIMAMMQNAIISEVSSTQIMRLFCSMNCSG